MTVADIPAMIADHRDAIRDAVGTDDPAGAAYMTLGYVSGVLRDVVARYPSDRDVIDIAAMVQAYLDVVLPDTPRILP